METGRIGFRTDALLAPEQARTLFFARVRLRSPDIEYVAIEQALRRVLAAPIVCDRDYPQLARSAMDGFAVRSADTPGRLRIGGEVRMGHAYTKGLGPLEAVRIPTGGALPAGADAVVPVEDARCSGESVQIDAAAAGDCVVPAGSDMRRGETMLLPGRVVGAPELSVLATLGATRVPVYRRPRVALISSGDELVDASAEPGPAQVRDSNRWALAGALEALGTHVHHLPIAPDDPARLAELLRRALDESDAVVLSGGSSVGERDYTPRIIDALAEPGVVVHGLRVKPGKPTVLAAAGTTPIIGLPGNPVSALMILEAVAAPILGALTGSTAAQVQVPARLAEPVRKRPGWTWFVPVRLRQAAGTLEAYPLELRSSSAGLLARASGFVVLDESVETMAAGLPVEVTRFLVGGI
jgi:molybdopterin molybdotransferase